MKTFLGYNILVLDHDVMFSRSLAGALKTMGAEAYSVQTHRDAKDLLVKHDYDFVLSSCLVSDGFLHELIDWCYKTLMFKPVFATLGKPVGEEAKTLANYKIGGYFPRTDQTVIFKELHKLTFNKDEFKSNLNEMGSVRGLIYELSFGNLKVQAQPVELSNDRIVLNLEGQNFPSRLGLLNISASNTNDPSKFSFEGQIEKCNEDTHDFLIHKNSLPNWNDYLKNLEDRQSHINNFLKKVAGY